MKKIVFIFLILLVFSITGLYSQNAKIFYVNLANERMDVRLGEEYDHVFKMPGIEPFKSTYMHEIYREGNYKLYYKPTWQNEWLVWGDVEPNSCSIQYRGIYSIVIDRDGNPDFHVITEVPTILPKVCVLNGSRSDVSRIEIGEEWAKRIELTFTDVHSGHLGNFTDMYPGYYSIYWQFPSQKDVNEHYFYSDSSGDKPEVFVFKDFNYYLLLIYTVGRKDYAMLFNITA